jgi:hypothetical protein
MERALGRYADVAQRSLVAGRALLGRGQAAEPGSGAGGGSAFALLLLGARRVSGTDVVLDAVGFGDHLARTDLLVTGAGTFDGSSLHHGVIAATAALALERGVPTVVVAAMSRWAGARRSRSASPARTRWPTGPGLRPRTTPLARWPTGRAGSLAPGRADVG